MKELALSRGFYPAMAIGPEFGNFRGGSRGKGDGKGKKGEKRKSKEKEPVASRRKIPSREVL